MSRLAARLQERLPLWRSTPVRLALWLVLLFAAISLATLSASYWVTRVSLTESLRADLREEIAGFTGAPTPGAIADLVAAESAVIDPRRRILSYVAPDGRVFGNGVLARTEAGFQLVPADKVALNSRLPYLGLTVQMRGGWLTVASSQSQIEDLGRTYVTLFLFSLLPTVIVALAGGLIMARSSQRRIEALGETLDRLAEGQLDARVPEGGRGAADLRVIGQRLNAMAAAHENSVAALRQVSADIAHDLKTPIQRVGVLLQRLAGLRDLPPAAQTLGDAALAETEGIVATFQALLQIAQIEGGSPRARFAPVDLVALAATFAEVYAPAAEDSGHHLEVILPDAPVIVTGEKALLGQVIANLLENALRHTPAGAHVRLSVAATAAGPELRVSDDGPGIPPEERGAVLRRLYRLERSRTTPGSGLGLSLVASIADLHAAALVLEDAPGGRGLGIRLTFPDPARTRATGAQ